MEKNTYNIEEIIARFLRGEASSTEKIFLNQWVEESGENRKVLEDYLTIWYSVIDEEVAFARFVKRIENEEMLRETALQIKNDAASVKRRKIFILFGAVAASAAIILLLFNTSVRELFFQEDQILEYYSHSQNTIDVQEVQLVLSDKKTISLQEKEVTIRYNQNEKVSINEQVEILTEKDTKYNELITPFGKRSKLELEDGTSIYINSGSKIIYPPKFQKDKREIYVDGEIFINVARDEKRPFTVKTFNSSIQVLGTTFNISASDKENSMQVVLVSGSVKVKSTNKKLNPFVLKPNEKLTINEKSANIETVDAELYISWIQGIYIYQSEKLATIVNMISKYYGVKIILNDDVSHLKCSGKLDFKNDLIQVLNTLNKILPISITNQKNKDGDYYTIKKRAS